MGFLFKKMRTIKNDEIQEKLKPYEQREKIQPLVMVVTIISREQSRYYLDAYQELGASLSLVFYSYSMPPEEYRNILGSDSTKKEIILTLVRGDLLNQVMGVAKERFKISRASKGICFACPIDSVSGIATYKFLSDQNRELREKKYGK